MVTDMKTIIALLGAEERTLEEAIHAVFQEAKDRRQKLVEQIINEINDMEISDKDFRTVLMATDGASKSRFEDVLCKAGFGKEAIAGWYAGTSVPPVELRKPLLSMHLVVCLELDLKMVQSPNCGVATVVARVSSPPIPIDQFICVLSIWADFNTRIRNAITNDGIVLLGELLAMTEEELLQIMGLGRDSVTKLAGALLAHYGVSFGHLTGSTREQYIWMSEARQYFGSVAGKPLKTSWGAGENQIHADPDLIEALKQAGITQQTQLATAPMEIIETICRDNAAWKGQLPKLFDDGYSYDGIKRLMLGMRVPPHLDPKVIVYSEGASK